MPHVLLRRPTSVATWIVAFVVTAFAPAARANTVLYGYTGSSGNLAYNVLAQFTLLENQVQVAIWNLQPDVTSDGATLGSIDFVLSGNQTTGTIDQRSGMEATLASGRNITPGILPGGTSAFTIDPNPAWHLTASTYYPSAGMELTTLGDNTHTILGPPNATTGLYSFANQSIANHNPYLYTPDYSTPVQFNLSVPGVKPDDTVYFVRFGFGAEGKTAEYDGTQATPEPGTWCLAGMGLIGAFVWRRKGSKSGA